ncbi:hypothetical protein CDL12_05070 [Handroanthus impetiginosus]|uniref:Prolamin-like domain-containing protein n=1 Tax=Handroanthus impetiginosus TaxID=429701 RepID=A0A2G9HXH0_9LAMI|nr:hypothetical protein CDL12_05070 [Handroanthus impetiginosus]
MSKPSPIQTFVLITCISMLATQCTAQELALDGLGKWFGRPIKVVGCFKALVGVPGCLQELIFSVISSQPRIIGPVCCRAAVEISEDCWPLLFPSYPKYPPSLKEHCADGQGSRFTTSKAVTGSSDGGSDDDNDNLII